MVASTAAARRFTPVQALLCTAALAAVIAVWTGWPVQTQGLAHVAVATVFAVAIAWRVTLIALSRPPAPAARLSNRALPTYTIIAPLRDEAAMVEPLMRALRRIDYPARKLQIILAIDADDDATLAAAQRLPRRAGLSVLAVPVAQPRTKPRVCNAALAHATGELVVIFDAEDEPDPTQLREAAARFAQGGEQLACLQSPLRISPAKGFLARQFALEYAAQFEVGLPALARLGLPFPLGGTSNHLRTSILREVGAWDAWNVTEDADLGFRLAQHGYRTGVLATPTHEAPPEALRDWLPQRTRWIKGYVQTWGVHMRTPLSGGWRRLIALQLTTGLSITGSVVHGPMAIAVLARVLADGMAVQVPRLEPADVAVLVMGWAAACWSLAVGTRRAGLKMHASDALAVLLYWPLQSLCVAWALWQFALRPHHWDKTPHHPRAASLPPGNGASGTGRAGSRAGKSAG